MHIYTIMHIPLKMITGFKEKICHVCSSAHQCLCFLLACHQFVEKTEILQEKRGVLPLESLESC